MNRSQVLQSVFLAGVLSLPSLLNAQEPPPFQPTIHWAYASFFGTGWYKISDERSGFIMRVPLRWSFGDATINEQGEREIAYTVRVPLTLGLARLDFDDISGTLDPDNLATASANVSVDADIPITRRFHLRPIAEVGYSRILDGRDSALTYRGQLKSRLTFESGKLDWALMLDYGIAGYEPNVGVADEFDFVTAGAEFSYPVNWFSSSAGQTELHWHVAFTDFLDEIEVQQDVSGFESVANYLQFGFALGKRDRPINIWRFKFDRLGLAYNFSTTGDLRGIRFVFRSLYEP